MPAWRYLGPQVEGGRRSGTRAMRKRLIRAGLLLPGASMPCLASASSSIVHGNISASTIERILSQLGAAEQMAGYKANRTARSAARAKKKNVGRYFLLRPGADGRADRKVAPGIYFRAGVRELVPVIMFVKPPRYKKRFPFYETAARVFDQRLLVRAREGFDRFVTSKLKKAA